MPVYNATYQEWANWTDWNPIFRYELAAYNSAYPDAPYGFTFPEVDTKPSYWDELPYLGEYSEAKRVFIWITLMPKNYGNVDGWFLGAPSEWGNPNDWPARHTTLTEAYANRYEDFMKKYAGANRHRLISRLLGKFNTVDYEKDNINIHAGSPLNRRVGRML